MKTSAEENDFLKSMKKDIGNGGFSVPEAYFENLNFNPNELVRKQSLSLRNISWKPILSIAAGFIILFGMWSLILYETQPKETVAVALSADEAFYDYMAYNTDDAQMYDIMLNNQTVEEIPDDAIIEYLGEEGDISLFGE